MKKKKPIPEDQNEPKKVKDEKGSVLTPEEMLEILSGEVSPEEMIRRWEKEAEKENGN